MAAPQQGGGQQDNSSAMLWWVAAVFAAIAAIWFTLKNQIISAYLFLKLYEVNFLSYLSHYIPIDVAKLDQLRAIINYAELNKTVVGFNDLITIGSTVGGWLRIPLVILLLLLAVIVYVGNTTRIYKKIYTMREFAKLERENWPQISSVTDLDLIKTDIDTGPWAMAMTPMQFCKRYKLLEEVRPQRHEGMSRKDWERIDVVLKRGEANKLFALQLGPLWKGTNKLPPHTKALFAAFAARINADTKSAAELLTRLSATAPSLDMSGVDALLKKHENTKLVQKVLQSHAYVTTVMAAMLQAAREDGVQASADFLWLKPVDRKLWYTLNTVGRQTPFIEVGGIFAHFLSEKEAGRKLLVPMIDEATNAVEIALKEIIYVPEEPTG
jgi:intracellular multiplication protein IcmP